jgi:hypothetical protein
MRVIKTYLPNPNLMARGSPPHPPLDAKLDCQGVFIVAVTLSPDRTIHSSALLLHPDPNA